MIEMSDPSAGSARLRIAVISLHTSPLDQPGAGDSGGMNVYIRSVAERLEERGVAIDVFTRCAGRGVPEVERVGPLTRIIQVNAGPCSPVPKGELSGVLSRFEEGVLARAEAEGPYDLVHSHYWLSGRAGRVAAERWDVPLVASFHTLAAVKRLAGREVGVAEPSARLLGERRAIRAADRILAPTPTEAEHLVGLYDADPARVRVVAPGVDGGSFRPMPKEEALRRLGFQGRRVVLFMGRLQPLKGPDVAIRTLAETVGLDPESTEDVVLAVVGGPSGERGAEFVTELRALASAVGIEDRVVFLEPRPHSELPWIYSAAEVLLMPSRSESFGLAALEAQSCGIPVVAADVGGLRYVVEDGGSGFLVPGHDPLGYAEPVLEILRDPGLAARLRSTARARAQRFPWEETADRVLSTYAELLPALAATRVS
jgi:D-inositol-3-phosphate glycosyltransferase